MKTIFQLSAIILLLLLCDLVVSASHPKAGFSLPDSVDELKMKYRTMRGLIILPVTINDSVEVNLILDTGCRNLILFGKKFLRLFNINSPKPVVFSGLGDGEAVKGRLSLGNKVSIREVLGEQIPVVIVPENNLFGDYRDVHGVIGYDIFVKFEVELNTASRTVTFRNALTSAAPKGFERIPLRIHDSRPVMNSHVSVNEGTARQMDLMIDTGSSLGLLLKSTNIRDYTSRNDANVLGIGFNGPVSGHTVIADKLEIAGVIFKDIPAGIMSSAWHDNASIGMGILKDYTVVLNYCKAYMWLKKNQATPV